MCDFLVTPTGVLYQYPASVAQLDARLTGNQEVAGSTLPGLQHSFVEI